MTKHKAMKSSMQKFISSISNKTAAKLHVIVVHTIF